MSFVQTWSYAVPRRRRRAARALLAPAIAVLLTGCSGTASGQLQPASPGQITATGHVPPFVMTLDRAGAERMARYYIEQLDEAYISNDPSILVQISTDDCASTERTVDILKKNKEKGVHQVGRAFEIGDATPSDGTSSSEDQAIDVAVKAAEVGYVDAQGAPIKGSTKPGSFTVRVDLTWSGAGWRIKGTRELVP